LSRREMSRQRKGSVLQTCGWARPVLKDMGGLGVQDGMEKHGDG
jgi:hypothetical protein